MRALLGTLLCFILIQSQVFALSGGPVYPATTNAIGTYAGVLIKSTNAKDPSQIGVGTNSLGLFTLGIPQSGLAEGAVFLFQEGSVFQGNITGVTSATDSQAFYGVIDAIRVRSQSVTNTTTGAITTSIVADASASGMIVASFGANRNFGSASSGLLLEGTAQIATKFYSNSEESQNGTGGSTDLYFVSGLRQTNAVTLSSGKLNTGNGASGA